MSELTKEYFDKKLEGVVSKKDLEPFATKKDLEPFATRVDLAALRKATKADLEQHSKDFKEYVREKTDELAGMTARGFDDIRERLDVDKRLSLVEDDIERIKDKLEVR